MAVLLANAVVMLHQRVHPYARDAWGRPVADEVPPMIRGPFVARLRLRPGDGADTPDSWAVGLAPEAWPVEAGDELAYGDDVYVITGKPLFSQVPGHPDVDYVRCDATLEPPEVP